MGVLLSIYHHLPPPARNLAASLRGYYLRSWRCGPETERLVEEALEREHWSAEQWKRWQEERLAYVLHRAATQVPYYRQQWSERRRRGDTASWEVLENWPVLDKEPLRAHPQAFVADDCDIRRMFHEHTSGTTGKPLDLWWSRETVRAWYALFEARWRRWYGVSRHDRWAILGGQLVVPVTQTKPPFWVWNVALQQLYMSSYHLSPAAMPQYLEALRKYRIVYLLGYTSALYELACGALDANCDDLSFRVIIANAEPVYSYQRETIERAFGCPLRETYGMAEIVAAAGECQAGTLHLWPEVGWIEVFAGEAPVAPGTMGDIVATGLFNADMPLIRYRLGDRGALSAAGNGCPCGRTLPVLVGLEGRSDDVLYTRDGRRIGRLDPVFKAQLPIREAQIIQEALDRIRVRYVPEDGFSEADARSIVERLQQRMGDVEVILEATDAIPRGPNGKFRAVICQLSPEERERISRQA